MASRISVLGTPAPMLNVTDVANYVFCRRKAALASLHVEPDAGSAAFTLGTTEHEYRRRVMLAMRRSYESLRRAEDVERFRNAQLLDCLLWEVDHVKDIAKATHPLFADLIANALDRDVVDRVQAEEEARLGRLAALLSAGASTAEAIEQLLPRHVEFGLGSLRLFLKGRVDEVWLRNGYLAPLDFKTHSPELRPVFEQSHWVQSALYGLILEETRGPVHEVGLRYSHDPEPVFRPLDELRTTALVAIDEARAQVGAGAVPPQERAPRCDVCHYKSRCFGLSRVSSPNMERREDEATAAPQELAFCRFHVQLSRLLRRRGITRAEVEKACRIQRIALLAELASTGEAKIATRRLLKGLERLVERRMGASPSHVAYFGGTRIEPCALAGCFFVIDGDAVTPWVLVDSQTGQSLHGQADQCRSVAKRALGLSCDRIVCVNGSGETVTLDFTGFLERSCPPVVEPAVDEVQPGLEAIAGAPAVPAPTDPPAGGSETAPPCFLGHIEEDRGKPLSFGPRGDRVHGVIKEEHCSKVAKDDLLVALRDGGGAGAKRLLLRIVEIKSAPARAATATRHVDELETRMVLEPVRQQEGDADPTEVTNDNLSGFVLRHATSEEVRDFLQLPAAGLPLGELATSRAAVTVRFPSNDEDALFRSFFVVGAKGKGKTSFVRELVSLAGSYLDQPNPRPAVIILDGEPSARRGASEFHPDTLFRAHAMLREQLGPNALASPTLREVKVTRTSSELAFHYSDIRVEDIPLLLPAMTETSANVLRRILQGMDRGQEFGALADALQHLREEIKASNQVDQRTGHAIAERLMSPQVEILEKSVAGATSIRALLQPGTVTVLDVAALEDDQRKVVALFLLLAIEKLAENGEGVNTLLVLDEAEKLFPRSRSGHNNQTTIQRVSNRVAGITKRGRRRRFGLVVCTQTPSDVDSAIVANCDVKVTFCVTGQDSWIRENLGADLVASVKALPTGTAYIDLRKLGVPVPVRTRLPKTS